MKSVIRWGLLQFLLICSEQKARSVASSHGTDCTDIKARSPQAPSGVYMVQPIGATAAFGVYCEMRADGGWTVFQRRSGNSVTFNRNWAAYKNGFGDLTSDHWLGLQNVFSLVRDETRVWILRVDLWDHEGGTAFAQYTNFRLGDETTGFRLHVGRFQGNAGDAIRGTDQGTDQNGFGFSTIDRDNDGCSPCITGDIAKMECTLFMGGGWWFSRCGSASLNGEWHPAGKHIGWASGLHWETWEKGVPYSFKATRMMITSV